MKGGNGQLRRGEIGNGAWEHRYACVCTSIYFDHPSALPSPNAKVYAGATATIEGPSLAVICCNFVVVAKAVDSKARVFSFQEFRGISKWRPTVDKFHRTRQASKTIGVQGQDLQMRHIFQFWNFTVELVVAQEQPWLGKLLDCRFKSGKASEAPQHFNKMHNDINPRTMTTHYICFHNPTTKAGQKSKGQQTVSTSSSMTSKEGVVHENDSCEVAALAIPAYKRPLENSLPSHYCPNAPFEVSPASLPRNKEVQRSFFRGTKDSVTKGSDF